MNNEYNYDVIICGTSLIHGILASLLTSEGKKVFQVERNHYYGGELRSENSINQFWKIFRPGQLIPADLERTTDWNIDFIPKFILSNGKIVKILAKVKALNQLQEFKYIDENLIYYNDNNQENLIKIPSSENNIQDNKLLNEEQKLNYQKLIQYIINHDNQQQDLNLNQLNFSELANKFNLDQQSVYLLGKVLAFELNDDYLNQPAILTVEKIKLYLKCKNKNSSSPFIYPVSGLGAMLELLHIFLRDLGLKGGLFIDIDEILFDDKGQVSGIKSQYWKKLTGSDQINAPIIIADSSYSNYNQIKQQNRVNSIGKIIRCICLINHTIQGFDDKSLSVIIPSSQTGRKNDIYITVLGYSQYTSAEGYYVCVISTNIETNDPEQELEAGLKVINPVLEKFITISDWYVQDDWKNNLYFTNSFNATNILDTEIEQVFEIYKYITGKNLDLNNIGNLDFK